VWGAAGGLGSMAIQLIAVAGAHAIGVISEEDKRDFVMNLGAKGVINRKKFDCWGQLPDVDGDQEAFADYMKKVREFGKAIWEITGKGNDVDFVFEHPARFVWMRQKRIQGSHFANLLQAAQANQLVIERRIDPCMSEVFSWDDIPKAHMKMLRNEHKPGNMAVLVQAAKPGRYTLEDCVEG
jgi:crotonyl-CoA carboxylase/reductase